MAFQLQEKGFTKVATLRGGLAAWKSAGYAVESTAAASR